MQNYRYLDEEVTELNTGYTTHNGRQRVVVTGLGAVSPLGLDVTSTWQGLIEGRFAQSGANLVLTHGFEIHGQGARLQHQGQVLGLL